MLSVLIRGKAKGFKKNSLPSNYFKPSKMNIAKNLKIRITPFLMLIFLLSGCKFFTEGKNKLKVYCPGLNVSVIGVSWSGNAARDVYVLEYDRDSQKKAAAYFEDRANGFAEVKNGDFYDIEIDNDKVTDRNDNVLVKTIEKKKGSAEVIFNETTRKIIIVEE
jgi:hypothetical protein